jgi:hypothetical protein
MKTFNRINYLTYYFDKNKKTIDDVNNLLMILSEKEFNKLNSLTRSIFCIRKEDINTFIKRDKEKYIIALQIHNLYDKAKVDDIQRYAHWFYNKKDQMNIHYQQMYMIKPNRQDNKTYINYGNGRSNANKIRFPKKCRKTAWKRFYKLFPHLKK